MNTPENIKRIRNEKGLTQKELGELCGMADSAIRRYESGRANPKIETLQKIANALNVPLYELAEYDNHPLDIELQTGIVIEETKHKLLIDFIRNMGYVVKFSGCPSRANMWMYDEEEKGFWTGDKFITSCQFGKNCETCKRRKINFYELSKNGKSVKIKITTMHGFFTMVENDIDKLLTLIFEHGDI